jgi:hypothetical protein
MAALARIPEYHCPVQKLTQPLGSWLVSSAASSQDWRFRMDPTERLHLWDEESARPFIVEKAASPENAYQATRSPTSIVTDPPTDAEWEDWDRADVIESCVLSRNRMYLIDWTAYSCIHTTVSAFPSPTPIFSTIIPEGISESHIFKAVIEKLSKEQRRQVGDIFFFLQIRELQN